MDRRAKDGIGQTGGQDSANVIAKGHPTGDSEKGVKDNNGQNDTLIDLWKGLTLTFVDNGFLERNQERNGTFKQEDLKECS